MLFLHPLVTQSCVLEQGPKVFAIYYPYRRNLGLARDGHCVANERTISIDDDGDDDTVIRSSVAREPRFE